MRNITFAVACVAACGYTPPPSPDAADVPQLPTIGFERSSSGADERSGMDLITVKLSAVSTDTVTVAYSVSGGTATPGVDFTVTSSMLTFEPGDTVKQIPVMIIDDHVEGEPTETIDIALGAVTGATLDDTRKLHEVTIADHILPRVQFAVVASTTDEATPTQLQVTLDKPAESDSTVVVGVSGGTPGSDYTITDGTTILISSGATTAMTPIGELDDALDEDDEQTVFTLRSPSQNLVIGSLMTSTHTITDNDNPPVLQFTAATSSASEGSGVAQVVIALDAPSGKTIAVRLDRDEASDSAEPGDAVVAGDGGNITFAPGEVMKVIDVMIVNDTTDEDDETVNLALSIPSNVTLGTQITHSLTITDDDAAPTVSFTVAAQTKGEATASATATIQLSAASEKTVVVPFTLSGSATLTADYKVTGTSRTFNPGVTAANIAITIVDDTLDEDDETAVFDLVATPEASLGATPTHTLTITDNDPPPSVTFAVSASTVAESVGTALVDVTLSAASSKSITVDYTFTGQSATTTSADATTGTQVTFAPGDVTKQIAVTVVNDTIDEDDEVFQLALTTATNATIGAAATHDLTITDDDAAPTVFFASAASTKDDDAVDLTDVITVQLSAASERPITVTWAINAATTANDPLDFSISTSTTLNFAVGGGLTKSIVVDVVGDSPGPAEPTEKVLIDLKTATNATIAAPARHTLTITD